MKEREICKIKISIFFKTERVEYEKASLKNKYIEIPMISRYLIHTFRIAISIYIGWNVSYPFCLFTTIFELLC